MTIQSQTYTIDEIAARFQVSTDQWARWTRRDLVPQPSFTYRGRARWLRAVVDEWERSGGDLFAADQKRFELEARHDTEWTPTNITETNQ